MTLQELRDLVEVYIQDENNDRFSEATLTNLINRAQQELQKLIDEADEWFYAKPKVYAVVSTDDAREFTLPSDLVKVLSCERQDSPDPIQAEWTTFPRRHFYHRDDLELTAGAARPRCYIRRDKLGVVAPAASYSLTMWYSYRLADLSANSDVSEIPLEHHNALALYAAKLAMASEERPFTHFEKELDRELEGLLTFVEGRQQQTPRQVKYIPT